MKAFDSVDHNYIFAILNEIGLPDWVITIIKALFNDIRVTPMVGRGKGGWIRILRGVKQGCPLSPLLFVLIYDTYIRRLLKNLPASEDEQICAFADDLMQITRNPEIYTLTTIEISLFEKVAGCSVHKGKSAIVCNFPGDIKLLNWVATSVWPDSIIQNRGTYLGVLFGNNITVIDIFYGPMNKFRKRLITFRPILKRFSISKRILTFNTFLYPIFSYIMQFYIIPFKLYLEIKRLTAKAIITFSGTAFKYVFLVAPRGWFGYKSPIKDLWVQNLTLITKHSNLQDFNGAPTAPKVPGFGIHSLNMDYHSLTTINTIITLYQEKYSSPFQASTCKNNASTYNFLLEAVFKDLHRTEIAAKLEKAGIQDPTANAKLLQDNGRLLNYRLPTHALVTQVSLFCNALTFDKRLNKAIPQPHRGADPAHPFPCRLCGTADDDYRHIFGACQVVERARETFARLIKIPISAASLGFKDNLHLSLLVGGTGLTSLSLNAILGFNMTVWLSHNRKYVPSATIPNPKTAADYIARTAAARVSGFLQS